MVYHRIFNILPCATRRTLLFLHSMCNSLHLRIPGPPPSPALPLGSHKSVLLQRLFFPWQSNIFVLWNLIINFQKSSSSNRIRTTCVSAKSFPSCLTLCDPIDCSPSGSSWKVVAESHKVARVLGLQRRRIQSGAIDETGWLRAFV